MQRLRSRHQNRPLRPNRQGWLKTLDPSMVLVAGGPEAARIDDGYFDVRAINADGSTGDSIATIYGTHKGEVPPGTYRILATLDSAHAETEVTVTDTAVATPELRC